MLPTNGLNRVPRHPLHIELQRGAIVCAGSLLLTGCAMQAAVERQTVEYNTAAAQMTNELTLLNIIRAKEELPIYYTSISRLSGSLQVTASGGFNAQVRTSSPLDTGATSSTVTSSPGTSATTSLTDMASRAVTSGGNLLVPSFGGQIVTGPSFDINILDTQTFIQGILTEIPFSTVDNYVDQDYDNQLLMRLLIERLEFTLKEPVKLYNHPPGTLAKVMRNVASGSDDNNNDVAHEFAAEVSCFRLTGKTEKLPPRQMAPMSRVIVQSSDDARGLRVQDVLALDGVKLDIDRPLPEDPLLDREVHLIRPSAEKRVAHLEVLKRCVTPLRISDAPATTPVIELSDSTTPPKDVIYAGSGKVWVLGDDLVTAVKIPVDIRIIFRSPEGVIKFLGKYLYYAERDPKHTYRLGTQPLFSVNGVGTSLVGTTVLGRRYCVTNDENRRRNMSVIALVEQLINLQKSATDRPVTVPVQVVP
jgi:hypothetical protein